VNLNSITFGASVGVDVGSRTKGIGVGIGLEGLVFVEVGCASFGFAVGADVGGGSSVAAGSGGVDKEPQAIQKIAPTKAIRPTKTTLDSRIKLPIQKKVCMR